MRQQLRAILFVLILLGVPGVGAASAQIIPGGHPREGVERREAMQMEYRGAVLEELNETLREWTEAWNEGDAEGLAGLYFPHAVVQPVGGGATLRSRGEIRDAFAGTLERTHEIELLMTDFGVDDRLAFIAGGFEFQRVEGTGGSVAVTGQHLIVFRREGGQWLIRSHLFREKPESEEPGS